MAESDWNYSGDVNLRHGGLFWRDTWVEGTVSAVRVTPYRDAGGPDNLFRIEVGEIHVPEDRARQTAALRASGVVEGEESRQDLVLAVTSHEGGAFDADEDFTLRIGPQDPYWGGIGEFPDPAVVLRSSSSLRRWVVREYLHAPEAAPAGPSL